MADALYDPGARVRTLCDYGLRMTEVEEQIPASRYFKSGKEMIRMASVYEEEGDLEKAFILYNKFTTLFVEKLPKHPGYKSATSEEKKNTRRLLELIFPRAELLKKKLTERYTVEENARQVILKQEAEQRRKISELQRIEAEARLTDESRRRLEAEQKMLAEQEAEFRRLQLQEQARLQEQKSRDKSALNHVTTVTVSGYSPSAPVNSGGDFSPNATAPVASFVSDGYIPRSPSPPPPVPPPSYMSVVQVDQKPFVPSRDLKPVIAAAQIPTIDRSSKPSVDHFTSAGEAGLKTVFVPDDLVPLFLHRALANSSRSIETCGILCGKLKNSQWHISHLLIPQQTGTSDSCDISNEENVVDFQDKHSLITLGWIHTHPTQTAFLSSVDQHTHWPYQKLLPEAIAIVCSPKFNETGYFYLTPDFGMDYIRNCPGKGFHEHPSNPPMFEKCPHVQIDKITRVSVIDLRIHR